MFKEPDIFNINIKKQSEDKYKLEYVELVEENEENEQSVKITFDIAKNLAPKLESINLAPKLESIKHNGYIGLRLELESTLEDIANYVAGEFLGLSKLGSLSLGELFAIFTIKIAEGKND